MGAYPMGGFELSFPFTVVIPFALLLLPMYAMTERMVQVRFLRIFILTSRLQVKISTPSWLRGRKKKDDRDER